MIAGAMTSRDSEIRHSRQLLTASQRWPAALTVVIYSKQQCSHLLIGVSKSTTTWSLLCLHAHTADALCYLSPPGTPLEKLIVLPQIS